MHAGQAAGDVAQAPVAADSAGDGGKVMEEGEGAWARLVALFRALFAGERPPGRAGLQAGRRRRPATPRPARGPGSPGNDTLSGDGGKRAVLPFDLHLTFGASSVRVFSAGPIDEWRFFQREGVPEHADVEFVTRLDRADRGTEAFQAYGMLRLRGAALSFPDLRASDALWQRVYRDFGLTKLPKARDVAAVEGLAWRPEGAPEDGHDRVRPARDGAWQRVGGKVYTCADALEVVRRTLVGAQRIAWIEELFRKPPPEGQVVHRYWLDTSRMIYLVRHHWKDGKRLLLVETTAEARRLCAASGAVRRAA